MWPWGHLAVGYLLYVFSLRIRRQAVDGTTVALLAIGTQFPDMVDKPLAWVHILPSGRSLAHSLLVAIPLSAVIVFISRREGLKGWSWGFVLGYLSHLGTDSYRALLTGQYEDLTFLLWPWLSLPDYQSNSPWDHLARLIQSLENTDATMFVQRPMGAFTGQLLLFIVMVVLWISQGMPGVSFLRRQLGRWVGRSKS